MNAGDNEEELKRLVAQAMKLPAGEARTGFLEQTCGVDTELLARLKQLVAEKEKTAQLLSTGEMPAQSTIELPPPAALEQEGMLIGRYKLLQKIGEGGMGSVWMAEQVEPIRRRVALKVVKLGMNTEQVVARFEAERQALALMDHPNIAKVFDAGATDTGRPYFVMELVRGIKITDYCDQHNLTTKERVDLFVKVCLAIQHAHEKGIIHRDIKPSNILVTESDDVPMPKVIDFGIAKATSDLRLTDNPAHTLFGQIMGTMAYMSPEQAEMGQLEIDKRSDVYSLGVLLYELLTGKTPFESNELMAAGLEAMRRILREQEPQRPSRRLSSMKREELTTTAKYRRSDPPKLMSLIQGDLDWIVMKTLEKDRTRRYDTTGDLAADLLRHLNHEPVAARPPSVLYRIQKSAYRHRRLVASALAVLVLAAMAALVENHYWPHKPTVVEYTVGQLISRADVELKHYDQTNALEQAVDDLKSADLKHPNDPEVLGRLGWAYWLKYEDSENDEDCQNAYNYSSNCLVIDKRGLLANLVQGAYSRRQHDWTNALIHLKIADEVARSTDGRILMMLVYVSWENNDRVAAIGYLKQAEVAATNDWDALDRIGQFYQLRLSRGEQAKEFFSQAVKAAPADPLPHRFKGYNLILLKSTAQAFAELKQPLILNRTPQALSDMGLYYENMENYTQAELCYVEASKADPRRYIYFYNAGKNAERAYRQNGDAVRHSNATNYFAQALQKIEDQLKGDDKSKLLHAYRAACLAGLGDVTAHDALIQARKEDENEGLALSAIYAGFIFLGDMQQAEQTKQMKKALDDQLINELLQLETKMKMKI